MSDRQICYVYILLDWLGVPRYVGWAKRPNRWTEHELRADPHNQLKNKFIEQTRSILGEIPKIKVRENLSKDDALKTEVALIAAIGRHDQGKGSLLNLSDGGEGGNLISHDQHVQNGLKVGQTNTELKRGFLGLGLEQRRQNSQRGGDSNVKNRTGFCGLTMEQHVENGRKGGKRSTELGTGGYQQLTHEQRVAAGIKSVELKVGWHALTTEQKIEIGRKAGRKTAELGKSGCLQRAKCPHCGLESNIPTIKRWHFDNCPNKPK